MRYREDGRFRKDQFRYDGVYGNYMHNTSVTVNNVTNITNVATGYSSPAGRGEFRGHSRRRGHGERNVGCKEPRLLRFYQTCGLRDRDRASAMSEGEFVDETCNVVGYGMQGVRKNASGIGSGVAKMAGGVGHMIGSTFKFVASFFG